MIDLIPATPDMAGRFSLQPQQVALGQVPSVEALRTFISSGIAMAAVDGDRLVAIGGITTAWPDRGIAWGLLSEGVGSSMAPIHRVVLRVLDVCPLRRIEAQVARTHDAGQRWVRMLGFQHEGLMRAFYQNQDYDLFARVK